MIESVISGVAGAVLRFVPEVFKMFTAKRDQKHELEMARFQLEADRVRSELGINLVNANATAAAGAGEMVAYAEALKAQGQMTGVRFIDALSASVRPVVTYWWLTLFTIYKGCAMVVAWDKHPSLEAFVQQLWTADDIGILSMLLGFWFCDRVMSKRKA